jgi:hypothetical protein
MIVCRWSNKPRGGRSGAMLPRSFVDACLPRGLFNTSFVEAI